MSGNPEIPPAEEGAEQAKRIAFLGLNSPSDFSGGRFHAWLLAEALSEAGWKVDFITNNTPAFYEDFNNPKLFPAHKKIHLHLRPTLDMGVAKLPDIAFDILLVVPHTISDTGFYEAALAYGISRNARIVLLNFESGNWFNALSPAKKELACWDGWKMISECASLVLSSAAESTAWARSFYDSAASFTVFEHLWAPINTRIADTLGEIPKEKRVLFLARFKNAEHKGADIIPELFCEAMRGYTAVFMVGMGKADWAFRRKLSKAAKPYGIKIEFLKALDERAKWREFKRAALVLFPSYFEGFGLPPVEAQYAGTPCIAFDLPVLREVSGDNIRYVPPGDIAAMRIQIAETLTKKWDARALCNNIGPAASFDKFMERANRLFTRLLYETFPAILRKPGAVKSKDALQMGTDAPCPLNVAKSQRQCAVFCPAEAYRLERCLAWYEARFGTATIHLFTLPSRFELAREVAARFPKLYVAITPYPECGVEDYYSPAHLPPTLYGAFKGIQDVVGLVQLTGPPLRLRYMPEYLAPAFKKDYNYFRILHQLGVSNILTFDATGVLEHRLPQLLDSFVGRHQGQRAWIMGNGPSLNQLDLSLLKDEITFGANRAYLGFKEWGFATKYWSVLDSLQCEKHLREWEMNIPDETIKFYPFEYLNFFQMQNAVPVNFYPPGHPEAPTNFMDPLNLENLARAHNFSNDPGVVYLGHTVIYGLLQIAVIMGCDPIYIIGVDHNYNISKEDQKRGLWSNKDSANHFHKEYGKVGGVTHEFHLPEMREIEASFDFAAQWAKKNNIVVKNATPSSKLKSFPMIPFNEALNIGAKGSTAHIPDKIVYVQPIPAVESSLSKKSATILVCTPDLRSDLFARCLASIEECTQNVPYELLIFENGHFGKFQHPAEINRALEIAQGDYFVTLDDDVEVTPGWLEAMIAAAQDDVGIVGCVNLNGRDSSRGKVRSVAVWVDYEGGAHHYTQCHKETVAVPCCCSCCWLINDRSLRFDLRYDKYYQEGDICLQSWEKGKKVLVSPHAIYHRGQGQMEALGLAREDILAVSEKDRQTFVRHWVQDGRMRDIYGRIRNLVAVPLPE